MAMSFKDKRKIALPPDLLQRLTAFIKEKLGASYPKIKAGEFDSIISKTAASRGFAHTVDYAEWILSDTENHNEVNHLASHLTVGETYFFRHAEVFDVFENEIIPEALNAHPADLQNLRIWSAGCSSGEEPYSIAISLERCRRKHSAFNSVVYASDINQALLTKAQNATYTKWSFRDTPDTLREKYFSEVDQRYYKLNQEVARQVSFSSLNLLTDDFPSHQHPFGEMDVIFCRNVLIYFDDDQIQKIVKKLYNCLRPGGWLITAPAEAPVLPKTLFDAIKFRNNFFFRRRNPNAVVPLDQVELPLPQYDPVKFEPEIIPQPVKRSPKAVVKERTKAPKIKVSDAPISRGSKISPKAADMLHNEAIKLFRAGKYREALAAAENLDTSSSSQQQALELATAFANVGNFEQARHWLDAVLLQDNLCVMAYYQKSLVLMAEDDFSGARKALQQALFLQPDFAAAYFTLGSLLLNKGKNREAGRVFLAALNELEKIPDDLIVAGTEDMTAGEMKMLIRNLQKNCN